MLIGYTNKIIITSKNIVELCKIMGVRYYLNDPKLKLIQVYFIPDVLFLEF